MQVYATGLIPYIGKLINFLLLSWMYAYYCFEYVVCNFICYLMSLIVECMLIKYVFFIRYKWNFNEVALDRRLDYFESYWPFFAGFGEYA